jgi:signal recognition particle subunit SRP19
MNPRVEEISDSEDSSEPSEMDIEEMTSLIQARNIPAAAPATSSSLPAQLLQPQSPSIKTSTDREKSKHYQCLYPIYFDKARTRAEGRRVGNELAVENPLAREMADAAANLGLRTVFEPDKIHPKDWSNPGRVRVLLKHEGKMMDEDIKNKHHLYILISQYLKANPTQKITPFRLPIAGIPMPKEMPEPAIPRGWKMNKILPLHSPALTGGGVSENFLQDMMAEMQGETGSAGAITGADSKKKKEKKKK